MKRSVTIVDAVRDEHLFARWFRGEGTWAAWLAFLCALFALPMAAEQLETYRQCTGRSDPPQSPATEGWLVCGRRAGKSFVLALIAVFLACFHDFSKFLSPGERGTVLVVAADRKQARVIMRYVRGLLKDVPMLARMIERETTEAFDLTNRVTIEVGTASFRSTRGYTIVAALLDELAFWPSEESANPDTEVIAAIRPGMATIPNAMLLCASSPYARRGALWEAHRAHFGQDDDPILVWQAATRTMNPTVPQSVVDRAYEDDPARASAEFGAQFRTDVESYIAREVVDAAIVLGRYELPPAAGVNYCAFVDPSGGSADSFTMAIAHLDHATDRVTVDLVREVKPPLSPEATIDAFAKTLSRYFVSSVTGDRYGGEFPRELFTKRGITYACSEKSKSDLYRDLLPAMNSGKVELPELPRLAAQLGGLERRTARGGKDSIDHAPGGHDDVANAVAGAVDLALGGAASVMNITPEIMQQARVVPAYMRNRHRVRHHRRLSY